MCYWTQHIASQQLTVRCTTSWLWTTTIEVFPSVPSSPKTMTGAPWLLDWLHFKLLSRGCFFRATTLRWPCLTMRKLSTWPSSVFGRALDVRSVRGTPQGIAWYSCECLLIMVWLLVHGWLVPSLGDHRNIRARIIKEFGELHGRVETFIMSKFWSMVKSRWSPEGRQQLAACVVDVFNFLGGPAAAGGHTIGTIVFSLFRESEDGALCSS